MNCNILFNNIQILDCFNNDVYSCMYCYPWAPSFINRSNYSMHPEQVCVSTSSPLWYQHVTDAWEYEICLFVPCILSNTHHTHTYCTYTHTPTHISLHGRLAAHKSHPPKRISRNNLSREGFYFIICQPRFVPAACTDPCSDKFACHLSWAAGIWACVIM